MSDSVNETGHDEYLDASGLNCPLPVLKAKFALSRMQAGQILRVDATDPHATVDFLAYCARSGHEMLRSETTTGTLRFYIRRAADPGPA